MRLGFRKQRTICHSECRRLLNEYVEFIRDCRGLAPATVYIREKHVMEFVAKGLGHRCASAEIASITPNVIYNYVISSGKDKSRTSRKQLVSSLRSFLRFLHVKGHVTDDLTPVVPMISIHILDRLPRGIAWEDVQKLLAALDRNTLSGRRNYAILMLAATYGVRKGQILSLTLKDIDWNNRLISFPVSKKGRPQYFPLLPQTAEALLAYLRDDRENVNTERVFLTVKGPRRSLGSGIYPSLKRLYRLAGVNSPVIGLHPIRHAFATRLTQEGMPMKTIADLLGHCHLESTFIYTKVDIPRLRLLADEWPKEVK